MPPDAPRYYTTADVAVILQRSTKWVTRAVARGELGALRTGCGLGARYRYTDEHLDAWRRDHELDPGDEESS